MKLVLCGSSEHYERFIEVLWRKDKDTSEYRYIQNSGHLQGFPRDTQIVKLGSFRNHPDHDEILNRANIQFDTRPRSERVRISDGPMPAIYDESVPSTLRYTGPSPQLLQAGPHDPNEVPRDESMWTVRSTAGYEVRYGEDEAASSEAPEVRTQPSFDEDTVQDALARVQALEQVAYEQERLQSQERETSRLNQQYQARWRGVGLGELPTAGISDYMMRGIVPVMTITDEYGDDRDG